MTEEKVYEIVAPGFDGATDQTDDHILWISSSLSAEELSRQLVEASLINESTELVALPGMADADYRFPSEAGLIKQCFELVAEKQKARLAYQANNVFVTMIDIFDKDELGRPRFSPAGSLLEIISGDDHGYLFKIKETGAEGKLFGFELKDALAPHRFISGDWSHSINGTDQALRFVFDRVLGRVTNMDLQSPLGWVAASREEIAAVQSSLIADNEDALLYPEMWDLDGSNKKPEWALNH